ncbi:Protein mms22 [Pseudocercospora fuligena]|uniref:Protein mms22 n=1 Tax=Pseudocercospora fuligena TaxID=685502 RepID=A0A8H6RSQ1_9PEZI|nr:Protein mms22 [Pseudocercospora fuligena]
MKRWQDRGEVADSDEEELELSIESSAETPLSKRPRLDQASGITEIASGEDLEPSNYGAETDDEDEIAWLPAKVATTYGRKGKPVPVPVNATASSSRAHTIERYEGDKLVPMIPAPPDKTIYEAVRNTANSPVNGWLERNTDLEDVKPGLSIESPLAAPLLACAAHSSDEDELPDVSQIFAAKRQDSRYASRSSTSSSLSERSVSPPTDSRLPDRPVASHSEFGHAASFTTVGHEVVGVTVDDLAAIDNDLVSARRSLRARKDIQLHPYLLEKAKYQRQFMERGLKPVRLVQPDTQREDDGTPSDPNSSQATLPSSSPAVYGIGATSERTTIQPTSTDRFIALPYKAQHSPVEFHQRLKRRKLHHQEPSASSSLNTPVSQPVTDQFSIPPSPPKTSSTQSSVEEESRHVRRSPRMFKFPPGFTPQPLPTPVVSSDARRAIADESSDSDSPPRTTRRNQAAQLDSTPVTSSLEDDSEVESEAELIAQRLQRERRRIKGVLPASWLKIDMHQQQRSRTGDLALQYTRPRSNTLSPEKDEPRKGVARRVSGRLQGGSVAGEALTESDGAESDNSVEVIDIVQNNADVSLDRQRFSFAPGSTVNDDLMENDFVDPMLAGPSRRAQQTKRKSSRQPRINTALRHGARRNDKFSEERSRGVEPATGRVQTERTSKLPFKRRSYPRKDSSVHLSIVDAPRSPRTRDVQLPQFVRLALRQSHRTQNQGRHGPHDKVIRLTTSDDTAEADSVLRAWRQGMLLPRHEPIITSDQEWATSKEISNHREPLGERSPNPQGFEPSSTNDTTASKPHALPNSAAHSVRQTRYKQTRLPHAPKSAKTLIHNQPRPRRKAIEGQLRRETSSRRYTCTLRSAQLETPQHDFDIHHREEAFERRMQCLTENVALPQRHARSSEFQIARYLYGNDHQDQIQTETDQTGPCITAADHHTTALPRRPRKSRPQRLNTEARQYRQPSELPEIDATNNDDEQDALEICGPVLHGFGPFGSRYPVDFNIEPLPLGLSFQPDTIIGSGELAESLDLSNQDLDHPRSQSHYGPADQDRGWGVWNEDVAADFSRLTVEATNALHRLQATSASADIKQACDFADQNVNNSLRSVVKYCSSCVYFADAVDRQHFAESLCRLVNDVTDIVEECETDISLSRKTLNKTRQYMVILAALAKQVTYHPTVSKGTKDRASDVLSNTASNLSKNCIADQFEQLRKDYESCRNSALLQEGIPASAWALSSLVILINSLRSFGSDANFWLVISAAFASNIQEYSAVNDFERQWHSLFTILPALDIDSRGVTQHSARSRSSEAWTIPKACILRTFELYGTSSRIRGFTVNDYIRTLLSRCCCLVEKWHWWRSEPILNTIFDFFSSRSLGFLHKEESRGPLNFLQKLGSQPSLEVLPSDRSFHIFVKLLTTSFLQMRDNHVYDGRKIAGLAWRFIPSHGRTYNKDMDLKQSDLDALQNHHDLLVALYYALPRVHRPKADLVRDLVDHTKSHRKACDVNVRAWANLTAFQASISEPWDTMQPLSEWFQVLVGAAVNQYRLAKSEAEHEFEEARRKGSTSDEMRLQAVIASNQRPIAATLVSALAGLKQALQSAREVSSVRYLVKTTQFWTVLGLFDPSQRRLLNAMLEAVQVMDTALEMEEKLSSTVESQNSSEDSQEFGDISALQEFAAHDSTTPSSLLDAVADTLVMPVGHFVSNVCGADSAPDESLLQRVITVWVSIANRLVRSSAKDWSAFLDDYSPQSWAQMRNTSQWRKYTPYFMARVVQQPTFAGDESVAQKVLNAWILSLVEREASLKFQHTLTAALLNHCKDERLLRDLPFAEDGAGQFNITLSELRQRRLALLSSLLSNMRESLVEAHSNHNRSTVESRNMYAAVLRQLMQAMKQNYQELHIAKESEVADATAQGSYIEFVQHVVSLLQQHTSDICKVDTFFTDSNAFPLPVRDPTYVVGKLKRYSPRLDEAKSRKELAVFMQTVSERAAADGQQQYLAEQLFEAMKATPEENSSTAPSLRYVLFTSMFPAYINTTFATTCGWILAIPILEACKQVAIDLIYKVELGNDHSVLVAVESVTAVLHSVNGQCQTALAHAGLSEIAKVMHVLAIMFDVCSSVVQLASVVQHATSHGRDLLQLLRTLHRHARSIEQVLDGAIDSDYIACAAGGPSPWPDTEEFVGKQIYESLNNWQDVDGRVFLRRGSLLKEVVVRLGHAASERAGLRQSIRNFKARYEATFAPRQRKVQVACEDVCELSQLMI